MMIEQEKIDKAKELRGMGLPYSAIARRIGVGTETVRKIILGEAYPKNDYPDRKRRSWPEWKEWAILHEKYGRTKV